MLKVGIVPMGAQGCGAVPGPGSPLGPQLWGPLSVTLPQSVFPSQLPVATQTCLHFP